MIQIENLCKKYGKKTVINHISLELKNQVYGLVGPNGAGKTTLIRLLAGVTNPSGGGIVYNNNKKINIGYLPQKFGCFPVLTVYEQMEYLACLKHVPRTKVKDEIERVLQMVHLEEHRDMRCDKLSGGMIRRLGVAQALLDQPDLLLLDEPAAGLDPEERSNLNNIVKQLNGDFPVLVSTHLVADVKYVCEKIIVMDQGRILVTGNGKEISGFAENRVFQGPVKRLKEIQEPYFLVEYTELEQEQGGRILFLEDGYGSYPFLEPVIPNTEDGYLALMKGKRNGI